MIKRIVSMREYRDLFDIKINHDAKGKEFFRVNGGGTVYAAGAGATITGFDAGSPGLDRFSGALIIDDAHKPDEALSTTIREAVLENYKGTLLNRCRGINVPVISLGQRVHEADLSDFIANGGDGLKWHKVILKGLDDNDNALYPEAFPRDYLINMREVDPYNFAAQQQQDPLPAGGALFKPEYFAILEDEPEMLYTFITADTAETDKAYNDATVFSFFGVYHLHQNGVKTEDFALHWINCVEIRVEPKDLKESFLDFFSDCCRYPVAPRIAYIEKKSSGSTLISVLDGIRGLEIKNIKREAKKSKAQRFLDIQPYVYSKLVSLPEGSSHNKMCLEHMSKITLNNTHRFDDIADTLADACKMAFIDKNIYYKSKTNEKMESFLAQVSAQDNARNNIMRNTNAQWL
jgi:predicted phage terminase large subunit-like protein